jgi:hypothetical protein
MNIFNLPPKMAEVNKYVLWRYLQFFKPVSITERRLYIQSEILSCWKHVLL